MPLNQVDIGNGEVRRLGNIVPMSPRLRLQWKQYGDTANTPIVARSQWREVDLAPFVPPIKDQDGVGACNAFATVTALETSRAMAGMPYERLSPGYLYGNINGQRDEGSLLEDGLEFMLARGTCLASTVPELAWRKSQWPASAAEEAKRFRVLEAYICPTFDAMASALQFGFALVVGILWYDSYQRLDGDWLPQPAGNYGGHALAGVQLRQRNGRWGIGVANSWSTRWGNNGYCVIPESAFRGPVGGWWAVRASVDDASDVPAAK